MTPKAPPIPEAAGVTLLLPWLDPKLSPNAKGSDKHWAKQRKRLEPYKVIAHARAQDARRKLGRQLEPPVKARWIFVPPDKRIRDIDNMTSNKCMKAAVDACVLDGLLEDDNSEVLTWGEPEVWTAHPLFKGPGVVLLLDEVTDA